MSRDDFSYNQNREYVMFHIIFFDVSHRCKTKVAVIITLWNACMMFLWLQYDFRSRWFWVVIDFVFVCGLVLSCLLLGLLSCLSCLPSSSLLFSSLLFTSFSCRLFSVCLCSFLSVCVRFCVFVFGSVLFVLFVCVRFCLFVFVSVCLCFSLSFCLNISLRLSLSLSCGLSLSLSFSPRNNSQQRAFSLDQAPEPCSPGVKPEACPPRTKRQKRVVPREESARIVFSQG